MKLDPVQDVNNKAWSTDTGKFGYQMLLKMGWSAGKGLGVKEDGETNLISTRNKKDQLGIGADAKTGDNWLATSVDYDTLLSKLNQKYGTPSAEPVVKKSAFIPESVDAETDKKPEKAHVKGAIRYHKLVKAKSVSNYSSHDMNCIMGGHTKKQSVAEDVNNRSTSNVSSEEYFKRKMAESKAKYFAPRSPSEDLEVQAEESPSAAVAESKKRKVGGSSSPSSSSSSESEEEEKKQRSKVVVAENRKRKVEHSSSSSEDQKKKKSKKKRSEAVAVSKKPKADESSSSSDEDEKKKSKSRKKEKSKKSKKAKKEDSSSSSESSEDEKKRKQTKNEKKISKKKKVESDSSSSSSCSDDSGSGSDKNKKKKKRKLGK